MIKQIECIPAITLAVGDAKEDIRISVPQDISNHDFVSKLGLALEQLIGSSSIDIDVSYRIGYKLPDHKTYIDDPLFRGSGTDDGTPTGAFTAEGSRIYRVQIDGTGTPDTFKWSKDRGSTWEETTVECSTGNTALDEGITFTFNAATGHTTGDWWEFTVSDVQWQATWTAFSGLTTVSTPSGLIYPAVTIAAQALDPVRYIQFKVENQSATEAAEIRLIMLLKT